jgi:8-amino-7-oxononanoate synthase
VFSTGMSPVVAAAAHANVERARREPALRARAVEHANTFRGALRESGADVRGHGPIVPWVIGEAARAMRLAAELQQRGVHAVAIRPPTVPLGTSRLRFTFTAKHTAEEVAHAIQVARDVSRETT